MRRAYTKKRVLKDTLTEDKGGPEQEPEGVGVGSDVGDIGARRSGHLA